MKHRATRPIGSRLLAGRWWAVAVLGAIAVVLVVLALPREVPEPRGASTATPSARSSSARDSVEPARPAPVRANARPTRLDIPAIGVSVDLIRLGLNEDQTVQVPEDGADAGWFDEGPAPGQDGSSVILGHVDSMAGPAVFYRLAALTPGDRVRVGLDDGSVAIFEVSRLATYPNAKFPARLVYAGSPHAPALNLVTCGGTYDRDQGGWQSNVVVYTTHVRTLAAS